ncbi:unnamed protein product [Darwinula stevensoni]|uniref:Carboxylesterase type B domain-containing protein n=1 Tax=Darwinula stevensoni TaxID=69355 RepID=A0A7R9A9A2_9CRUS|nr:unnamed protein product [Darwinula stevensoni]CAG0897016.1 unnamed protein product [Darwinula stevensoni]
MSGRKEQGDRSLRVRVGSGRIGVTGGGGSGSRGIPEVVAPLAESGVRIRTSARDRTLEAISDALFVAPLVKLASIHAQIPDAKPSYLYVFDYETRYGSFPQPSSPLRPDREDDRTMHFLSGEAVASVLQRLGCVHGEELAYVFGAPLVDGGGMDPFPGNFSRNEQGLSLATIGWWANFVKTGSVFDSLDSVRVSDDLRDVLGRCRNPNGLEPPGSPTTSPVRNRQKDVHWSQFDFMNQRYLSIDLRPKVKTHYRAHKLSFWMYLVPALHRAGEDVPSGHHLLHQHHNLSTYDGVVRTLIYTRPHPSTTTTTTTTTTTAAAETTTGSPPSETSTSKTETSPTWKVLSPSAEGNHHGSSSVYSTALAVTIGIGLTLLLINILIFLAVYYQTTRRRNSHSPRGHPCTGRKENGQIPCSGVSVGIETEGSSNHLGPEKRLRFPAEGPCGSLSLPRPTQYGAGTSSRTTQTLVPVLKKRGMGGARTIDECSCDLVQVRPRGRPSHTPPPFLPPKDVRV